MHVDVLIVGAGISGIAAAHFLQKHRPKKTYAILEAREDVGGTWDLFRYPGIRSDSDMYTLAYSFRPWASDVAIADGASIRGYVRATAEEYGILPHVQFQKRVRAAHWSSEHARWSVEVEDAAGARMLYTCNLLYAGVGYYDYERGYTPELSGRERFTGEIVHPQHWSDSVAYEGKRVVVIGSGATAMTLVPELAKRAAHVTMLQRSPTYVLALPSKDPIARGLRRLLPERSAYRLIRLKNILLGTALYRVMRWFPKASKRLLLAQVRKHLRGVADVDCHFEPPYDPWDQRLCLSPDADFFQAMRSGRASVETATIDAFTEAGIRLASGKELPADLVVTATGLEMRFGGGMQLSVDGAALKVGETLTYKGVMLGDVPNFVFAIGYVNAPWTLKSELTAQWACRLLGAMDAGGSRICWPRLQGEQASDEPLIDFDAGYIKRAAHRLPRQGLHAPWRMHQDYLRDAAVLLHAPIDDGVLELRA